MNGIALVGKGHTDFGYDPKKWYWRELVCATCKKKTYRPPGNTRPCDWCENELKEAR